MASDAATISPPEAAPRPARSAAGPGGHSLDVEGVSHRFGTFTAIDDVTLNIEPGEIVALLGPSGCGKTTLLRVIAGFLRQERGAVLIDGRPIDRAGPGQRNVGIVFQNYALFPHMTAAQNVAYGLEAKGRPRPEVKDKVARFLDVVQMGHLAGRLPRQLSGGQQQRVALARALAVEPSILLLDEPFAALDRNLRLDMQIEIKRLQRQFGLTAILVTHDQDEAMSIADRIAVMNRGRVEQFDTPVRIYDQPASLFVNGFIGSCNLLRGHVLDRDGLRTRVRLDAGAIIAIETPELWPLGTPVLVSLRPEEIALFAHPAGGRWPVQPRLSLPIGGLDVHDLVLEDGTPIKVSEPRNRADAGRGERTFCGLAERARPTLFPANQHPETNRGGTR